MASGHMAWEFYRRPEVLSHADRVLYEPLRSPRTSHAAATSSTTRYARRNLLITKAYMTTANRMLT